MRILQVCNKPPYPPHDGGSLAMFHLAGSLIKLGHTVTVFTMSTPKHQLTAEQEQEFSRLMDVNALYVNTSPGIFGLLGNLILSDKPYNVQRFISRQFETALCKLLQKSSFDLIQLEGLYLAAYIPAIRENTEAVIALRAHNIEYEIWERLAETAHYSFKKIYFRNLAARIKRYEINVLNKYDLLVPITPRDLDIFKALGNRRPAFACPAGVEMPADPTKAEEKMNSLFFLGSLDWIPNQEGLLWFLKNVFPKIRKQYPSLEMHIAGRNATPSMVRKLSIPGVVFHGEVPDAGEFIRSHRIMVAPCFSGSGMRLKLVEAMSHGRAVITTPIGAEGLNVRHDEQIIIAEDAVDFIGQIERLMKYPEISLEIGQNARIFVAENFNNLKLASKLADFYKLHLK
jgi:glycosyltransferase involved in cell wall biosynthesis